VKADEVDSGAVTLIQRFGSAANLNIHLHCLVLDGVYRRGIDGAPEFVKVPAPTDEALQMVLPEVPDQGWTCRLDDGGWRCCFGGKIDCPQEKRQTVEREVCAPGCAVVAGTAGFSGQDSSVRSRELRNAVLGRYGKLSIAILNRHPQP